MYQHLMKTFLALAFCIALHVGASDVRADGSTLQGQILCDGKPVTSARVSIRYARPRTGPAYLCPGCYFDCGRSATTGPDGRWIIDALDPALKFSLLVVADGHAPKFTTYYDTAKNDAIATDLIARDTLNHPRTQTIRGRVLMPDGTPLMGATVESSMAWWADGGGGGGRIREADPLAVTNDKGEFILCTDKEIEKMDVRVSARGHTTVCADGLRSGNASTDIVILQGSTVKGRLVQDGHPSPNIIVGLVGTNRSDNCGQRYAIATNGSGEFEFVNVRPGVSYSVYLVPSNAPQLGVLTAGENPASTPRQSVFEPVQTQPLADGQTLELPDIILHAGLRVRGRLIAENGTPLPEKSIISFSHTDAWLPITAECGPDGRFEAVGMPYGEFMLSITSGDLRVSERNESFDPRWRMIRGLVNRNIDDLVIELTAKPAPPSASLNQPENFEIAGVEKVESAATAPSAPPSQSRPTGTIKGVVRENGAPVPNARVLFFATGGRGGGAKSPWTSRQAFQTGTSMTTDQIGRFERHDLDASLQYAVCASAVGKPPGRSYLETGETEAVIELTTDSHTIGFRNRDISVTANDGTPIANALVVMGESYPDEAQNMHITSPIASSLAVTDAKGHGNLAFFSRITPPVGKARPVAKHRIFLELPGTQSAAILMVREVEDDGPLSIRLPPVYAIRGSLPSGANVSSRVEILLFPGDLAAISARPIVYSVPTTGAFEVSIAANPGPLVLFARTTDQDGSITTSTPKRLQIREGTPILDAGELVSEPGFTVAGTIELPQGATSPPGGSVSLQFPRSSYRLISPIDADNRFAFYNIPAPGPYTLELGTDKLAVSLDNVSTTKGARNNIRGKVTRDHYDLRIRLGNPAEHTLAQPPPPRLIELRGVPSPD